MKLDPTVLRTMGGTDFRVLEAVEKGMSKHALVPVPLIASMSSLRHGGTGKIISSLLRDKLLSHDKSCGYDGYRLTNAGYDILALNNLKQRGFLAGFGDRIGTGKESDVYLAVHPNGSQVVLKIHRLGRTSFRNVKQKRDYFQYHNRGRASRNGRLPSNSSANSWLFLSRQSALKEFAFMKALYNVDYPTPQPLAHNRHMVVMSLIRGVPLYQVHSKQLSGDQAASIFHQASDLAFRLAQHGLVHCDLNEFNLLVDLSGIQQLAMDSEHDPYVRHSGMSVAAKSNPGMLSARGPWEDQATRQFGPEAQLRETVEQAHTPQEEAPPQPKQYLENGEAKPIVTLIDFPQMVSTQHPNAEELYERDMKCLHKFFTQKLHCQIPEEEEERLLFTWESCQARMEEKRLMRRGAGGDEAETGDGGIAEEAGEEEEVVCLASKAQLRLDQELQASGYSEEDANRDSELYYYYNESKEKDALAGVEEDNESDEDKDATKHDDGDQADDDDDSLGMADPNDDTQSMMSTASAMTNASAASRILASDELRNLTRQQLQEQARLRVAQQLKRKSRQRGAFRKHNSNKTFLKGKRIFEDDVF